MNVHVIYRLCDKVDSVHGLKRPFNMSKQDVIKVCFKSLVNSFGDYPWAITVIADDVRPETKQLILDTIPKSFTVLDLNKDEKVPEVEPPVINNEGKLFNSYYLRMLEFNPPLKNLGSLMKAYEIADGIKDPNTWIYFLEDDYLHHQQAFFPRMVDFNNFCDQYKFALPVFVHPSDYPDQYTRLLTRCYIYQTTYGYWREVCSTTGTFMCKATTYKKFAAHLKACGTDDGKISAVFKKSAFCFSPLPGFATHCHEGVMSNFVNWEQITKDLLQ